MITFLLRSKIIAVVTLVFLFTVNIKIFAQQSSEKTFYDWFDNKIGKENTGLNNAPLYINPYRTIKDNTLFLVKDQFTIGTIMYDGQPYFDVKLKYDIYTDQLVLNPPGQFDNVSVALIQEKTTSFSIYNKDFVKLNPKISSIPDFTAGYYEIYKPNENLTLYIKHRKDINKMVKDDGVFYSFKEKNQFYLVYNNNYYVIKNKNSFTKIFPEFKSSIKTFYNLNSEVYKNDDSEFMKNLTFHINSLLKNKSI